MRYLPTLLLAPAVWVILVASGYYAAEYSEWGRAGHPSLSLVFVILTLMASPLFGAIGLYLAATYRHSLSRTVYGIGIFVNSALVLLGAGFLAYMWLS